MRKLLTKTGEDGKIRKFLLDSDGYIYYSGYAKDFQEVYEFNSYREVMGDLRIEVIE